MKKLKKLVLKKEVIASLSNPEMGRVVGGYQDCTVYATGCATPIDGTYIAPKTYEVTICLECPTYACPTGRDNTCPPRCCEYGCCEPIGC